MGHIRDYANRMRQKPTAAEARFFERVAHLNCYSQVVIGRFIADFLFPDKGLVFEVDGGYHDDPIQVVKDAERDLWMRGKGLKVIRIRNEEVDAFSLSRISSLPEATPKIRAWLYRAIGFTLQTPPLQIVVPKQKRMAPKREQAAKSTPSRIYAVFIPGEPSVIVEGRPRDLLRRIFGVSGAVSKRFKTRELAQAWIDRHPKKVEVHGKTAIDLLKSPGGGWTRATLASLGVPWPPPKGWKKALEAKGIIP